MEALRFFVRMDVDALTVFDQSPFQGLPVGELDHAAGKGEEFGKLCGAEPACSGHDLEAVAVGANGDRLDEAGLPDALGQFVEFGFLEGLAGVGGGLVNLVDGDELEGAAVLHLGCSP